jgi:hypothetical protein
MTEQLDTDYPVVVTERNGRYELRIRELLLTVHGRDLQLAYEELINQKNEIIDSARAFGTLDDVPPPERPALLGAQHIRPFGPRGILSGLSTLWRRSL